MVNVLLIPGVGPEVPWYAELGILAGALTSTVIVWKLGIKPGARVIWAALQAIAAAIIAAPQIAAGIEKLTALLEGDVLERLDAGAKRFDSHEMQLGDHQARIGRAENRLDGHDQAIAALHERLEPPAL